MVFHRRTVSKFTKSEMWNKFRNGALVQTKSSEFNSRDGPKTSSVRQNRRINVNARLANTFQSSNGIES
jgi:hypothetical protein